MISWIFKVFASVFFTVLCYVTNPIVVLFADEDGELHGFLHYFQTWDNSTNPSDLLDILPRWLTSWYDGRYVEVYRSEGELAELGRGRWYTDCINTDFTIIERIKRYICRVYWLTRNSAYGFCFYLLGIDMDPSHNILIYDKDGETIAVDSDDSDVWMYCNSKKIFWKLHWNIFLGYKLRLDAKQKTRCMIANRVTFKIE